MMFVEEDYVDDMIKTEIMLCERYSNKNLVAYIETKACKYLKSKVKHSRNDATHIFNQVIHQDKLFRDGCNLICKKNHATIFSLIDIVFILARRKNQKPFIDIGTLSKYPITKNSRVFNDL